MKRYDVIIAGGGCAGLSMAYYLTRSNPAKPTILVIDREAKDTNDRTWCFWTTRETPFAEVVSRRWEHLTFIDSRHTIRRRLAPYTYQMIRSADFYAWIRSYLLHHGNTTFLQAEVRDVQETSEGVICHTDQGAFHSDVAFHSLATLPATPARPSTYRLLQHFKGWWVHCPDAGFNPSEARLMDFNMAQNGAVRFFYFLPLSSERALVEYTVFSGAVEPRESYNEQLHNYLTRRLGQAGYRIEEEEFGVIPMTNLPMSDPASPRIIPIGTAAGMVKPTTGYAFLRIQAHCRKLAEAYVAGALQSRPPHKRAGRFAFYDNLLLHIIARTPEKTAAIFSALFRHNRIQRIFAFLDERSTLWQEVLIFSRLPFGPFLRAVFDRRLRPVWEETARAVNRKWASWPGKGQAHSLHTPAANSILSEKN